MKYEDIRIDHRIILELINPRSCVLDLGCGAGELLYLLIKEKNARGQGIEIDEQAIHACVAEGLSVFQQDVDTGLSEYADDSFDFVILSQTMQQVRKPDFIIREATRVGEKAIISFPNFVNYEARFQIFFKGRVPVTHSLPYAWYDTPNLHFLSIADFINYCNRRGIRIEDSAFVRKNKKVRLLPNLLAETGIFLLSRWKNT